MLAKRKLGRGKVRVTFTMPALPDVDQLSLVGDFNDWSLSANPLEQAADGQWSVALTLDGGRDYQFRYLANGASWHNDWQADAYVPNEHGSDNSVVSLADGAAPATKKSSRKKSA